MVNQSRVELKKIFIQISGFQKSSGLGNFMDEKNLQKVLCNFFKSPTNRLRPRASLLKRSKDFIVYC
jgi:hypothetical protein